MSVDGHSGLFALLGPFLVSMLKVARMLNAYLAIYLTALFLVVLYHQSLDVRVYLLRARPPGGVSSPWLSPCMQQQYTVSPPLPRVFIYFALFTSFLSVLTPVPTPVLWT